MGAQIQNHGALPEEQEEFLPLSPDFVVELRSRSDRLQDLQEKMREYIDNGTRLGWLIDPKDRKAYIYRTGQTLVVFDNPATLSGDPELPGFELDLTDGWTPW